MTVTSGLVLRQIVVGSGPFRTGSDENMCIGADWDFIVETTQRNFDQFRIRVGTGKG
jgi:hypothetical protein